VGFAKRNTAVTLRPRIPAVKMATWRFDTERAVTFAQRAQGDVLIAWEKRSPFAGKRIGGNGTVPSITIQAEPPVMWSTRWWVNNKRAHALWPRNT
jgi:ABC-type sulfate transport system substrate-binding protein